MFPSLLTALRKERMFTKAVRFGEVIAQIQLDKAEIATRITQLIDEFADAKAEEAAEIAGLRNEVWAQNVDAVLAAQDALEHAVFEAKAELTILHDRAVRELAAVAVLAARKKAALQASIAALSEAREAAYQAAVADTDQVRIAMEVWDTSIASDRSRHLLGSAQRRVERDQNWQALRQVLIAGTDDGTGWFEAWLTSVYDGARHAGNCIVEEMQTEGRLWWTAMQHPLPVLKDAGLGLLQGTLNTLNGAQDSIIGMLNLGIQYGPFGAVVRDLRAFGIDLTLPSPDWSRDLVIDESDRSHWWSKFLGGEGLVTLATLGVGELAEAARAGGAAARGGLFSSGELRSVERASAELIEAVGSRRAITWADEGTDALRYLDYKRAEAAALGAEDIILRRNPGKPAVLEEFLHGRQQRLGIIDRLGREGAEYHVKDFMIRHRRLLGLGDEDVEVLRRLMELGL
jgi:hypothetical protein